MLLCDVFKTSHLHLPHFRSLILHVQVGVRCRRAGFARLFSSNSWSQEDLLVQVSGSDCDRQMCPSGANV